MRLPVSPKIAAQDFVNATRNRGNDVVDLDMVATSANTSIAIKCHVTQACATAVRFLLSFADGYFVKEMQTGLESVKQQAKLADVLLEALLLKMDSSHQKKEGKRYQAELRPEYPLNEITALLYLF